MRAPGLGPTACPSRWRRRQRRDGARSDRRRPARRHGAPRQRRHTPEPPSPHLAFTGDLGGVLRTGNFRRAVKWTTAVTKAGAPTGFHFHDLRHTGNNLAAASGASTRELMHRMGHASMRAALIYQHATSERDREIAESMDKRIAKQQGKTRSTKPAKTRRSHKGEGPEDGASGEMARVG